MPRITVTTDPQPDQGDPAIMLDEPVQSEHLSTGHAAAQLVERLAWAIIDAEGAETHPTPQPAASQEHVHPHAAIVRARRTRPIAILDGARD